MAWRFKTNSTSFWIAGKKCGTTATSLPPASCVLTLRDDYLDLVEGDKAKAVAGNAWMLDEFLVEQMVVGLQGIDFGTRVENGRRTIFIHSRLRCQRTST